MAQPFSKIVFEINDKFVQYSSQAHKSTWNIEYLNGDTFSDVLERLSKKSNFRTENFSFIYQGEHARFEAGEICYYAEALDENDEPVLVGADGRIEKLEDFGSEELFYSNTTISQLDDVVCPPGLSPIINIDLCLNFFEVDGNAGMLDNEPIVAWIEVFHISNVQEYIPLVTLLRAGSELVDPKSGETFLTCTDFMVASKINPGSVKVDFGVLLLRNRSHLPKWAIAPDLRTSIAVREGTNFTIDRGAICLEESENKQKSKRWLYPENKNSSNQSFAGSKVHWLTHLIMDYISS